uniref:ATP synthase subunit a n=2 Tax=Solanaceae TaxID=4070 RepID=A0A5J6BSM9_9SOLA|nr:ATPase subunit 6 [Hyoscyamus niger]AJK91366.1 ATPase subunit 6 [Hyoscyamus niger]QEP94809.1 ATPase subunit 6 [Nicotiana tabacum/Hyoscyamus niger cybrid]QEP94850.1 ATPase subunit 6 [Nicotiana tabacum/Hyoscyamus niger cybrid]
MIAPSGASGSARQEVLQGIPVQDIFPDIDIWDIVSSPFYFSGTVHIPGEIEDPLTIVKLSDFNKFLVNVRYDFFGGVIQPAYTQSLQRELDVTSEELLAAKLDFMFNREYGFWYDCYCNCKNPGGGSSVPSPLEQFEIIPLIPMKIGNLYFSFTNPSLFMLLTLSLVLLLVYFVTKKGGGNSVPNAWQSLVELIYDFVLNPVNEQIGGLSGNVKQKFSPRISVTFTFSLFCNPQGMIPYSFTVTSHFLITLGLSFSIFIGITIVGFQKNGLHFLSFLLPAGVPLPLAPFLVLLELIPYCFRALSSGIRLFANMMAGHSSVKILSGFAWTMLCMNDLLYFIGDLGPLFIVLALTGLELGVAISQAHVSTILICIYLNDAINLHQSAYFFIIEQKRV